MSAIEQTVILTPRQCAWDVARVFGRRLATIVAVTKGVRLVHTEFVDVDPQRLRVVS